MYLAEAADQIKKVCRSPNIEDSDVLWEKEVDGLGSGGEPEIRLCNHGRTGTFPLGICVVFLSMSY